MIAHDIADQPDLDQDERKDTSMEDSTTKTIESLRGQLLVERSVSKTARERADELAKRVVELEEKLKIVTLQRRKAEMATADVLAILENHGVSELSDELDSSSEQEMINCESQVGNNSPEVESLAGSKMGRNHTDEFSSSELESSPLPGRSLYWKSGKDSSHSREKKNIDSSSRRRRSISSSASASPRHRIGKSCRQIRCRETRSATEESPTDNSMLAPHENGAAISLDGCFVCSDIKPGVLGENSQNQDAEAFPEGSVSGGLETQKPAAINRNCLNKSEEDMEKELECQGQLIGKYEEDEKSKREWEEKFRENNNSTPDSCEHGDHSDVTEERDEARTQAPPYPGGMVASDDLESKLKAKDACVAKEPSKSQSGGFQAHSYMGYSQHQKSSAMPSYKFPTSLYPVATGKQDRQYSGNYSAPLSHICHYSSGHDGNNSPKVLPSHAGSSFSDGNNSGSKNEHHALVPSEAPDQCGSVLDALHQAKLSLRHRLSDAPTREGGPVGGAIECSVGDRREVPIGCAGLFRVPSDFHLEATTQASLLGSNPQLSLSNYYAGSENAPSVVDSPFISPHMQPRSSVPTGGFVTSPYQLSSTSVPTVDKHFAVPPSLNMESKSKFSAWGPTETWPLLSSHKPISGLTLDTSHPSSSRSQNGRSLLEKSLASSSSTYPFPSYPFSPDYVPRLPSKEELQCLLSSDCGMPPPNHFSSISGPQQFLSSGYGMLSLNHFSNKEPQRFLSSEHRMPPSNPLSTSEGPKRMLSSGSGMVPSNHFSSNKEPQRFWSSEQRMPPLNIFSSNEGMLPLNIFSSNEGRKRFPSSGYGMPPSTAFSFPDENIKPKLYR